jgi:hypothetical protein
MQSSGGRRGRGGEEESRGEKEDGESNESNDDNDDRKVIVSEAALEESRLLRNITQSLFLEIQASMSDDEQLFSSEAVEQIMALTRRD